VDGSYSIPGNVRDRVGGETRYTLETWREIAASPDRILQETEPWRKGVFRTLFLWSQNPGVGKTGLGVALLRDLAERGEADGRIVRMPHLSIMSFAEQTALVRSLSSAGAVLLDDVHRFRFSTAAQADLFHTLADMLLMDKTRLVMTANASFRTIQETVGADSFAAFDRLRSGGLLEIAFEGDSLR